MTSLVVILCVLGMSAEYPTLYLRGDISGGWSANDKYKFNVDQNGHYTLHVDKLKGAFKVADSDWSGPVYGCIKGKPVVEAGMYTLGYQTGEANYPNFEATNELSNVDLSFDYVEGSNLKLKVVINGVEGTFDDAAQEEQPLPISGTLPVLYINVYTDESKTTFNNEIISKDLSHKDYFSFSEYWLDLNGCDWMEGAKSVGTKEEPLPLEIKARGNWTRIGFAKKPFKLKLGKKQNLLGMTKSKHFAILAHADDTHGYLRNYVGFNLGKRIGLPWTPSAQPIEVVINGDYRGVYFLTESIRVEEDRVNIAELDDNCSDPALVSGGYLVELDNYDEDNQISMEEKTCGWSPVVDRLRVTFDTPEEYSDLQRRFVADQFTAMNEAIGSNSDDTWKYLDLDDAARYYLVEEIISHVEAYHGSTYLFRDRGENQKWHFSPLWDCGNAFNGPTDGHFYHHCPFGSTWIPSMRENAKFNQKVKETWLWFMNNKYDGLEADIAAYVNSLKEAAKADHDRWAGKPTPANGQGVTDNRDMDGKMAIVLEKLNKKIAWMKGVFGDYATAGVTTEPARDTTAAAPLPDYLNAGVENVSVDDAAASYSAEYFDLTGSRIFNPVDGQLLIERRGPNARKIRF